MLKFTCSGLGLESGQPCFQAIDRNQTLGLRSVVPLASSSPSIRSGATQSCRGAKQYFSCRFRIPYFNAAGNCREPHAATARPTAAKLEYQPPPVPTTQELWRSCGTPRFRGFPRTTCATPALETERAPQARRPDPKTRGGVGRY
jgi:hypothetical protein